MPQLFQVLKCYKCSVFQVHQTKKSIKWECKLCGEKQSIKRHYGIGTGKECRLHVQKLNGIRGEIDELSESAELNKNSDEELENCTPNIDLNASKRRNTHNESKWSNFIDGPEFSQVPEVNESMYLGNTEVVLEVPVRKRKKFKPPSSTIESATILPECKPNEHVYRQRKTPDVSTANHNTFFKGNPFKVQTVSNPEIKEIHSENECNLSDKITEQKIQNETHIEIKTYVPAKVNTNSKWAEFADEPDETSLPPSRENSFENISSSLENLAENISPSKPSSSENVARNLFTLCDESELDDVLEF